MRRWGKALVEFLKDESGPTSVEYAIVMSLIAAFCLPTLVSLGGKATNTFTKVSNTIGGTGS
jgi:pilus assembly protein Flp/PilA